MRQLLAVLAAILALYAHEARAQADFPARPVVIIVPYPAGGPSDVAVRVIADELSKLWNQQVVVDNKGGGGTVIGTQLAARAKPDGYTWLMTSGAFVVNPGIRSSLPYDTIKDFSGIAVYLESAHAVVAAPGFAPNTLEELFAEAKKRPADKPMTFASSGVGTSSHMTAELLTRRAGIPVKHIPYQGESAATTDVMSGRVDFQVGTWSTLRTFVESGKLKLLAISYRNRLPEVPNTPIVDEMFPGLSAITIPSNVIVVPSGVPADIKAKIAAGLKRVIESDVYRQRMLQMGNYPYYMGPDDTDTMLKRQIATWAEVSKAANIRAD